MDLVAFNTVFHWIFPSIFWVWWVYKYGMERKRSLRGVRYGRKGVFYR